MASEHIDEIENGGSSVRSRRERPKDKRWPSWRARRPAASSIKMQKYLNETRTNHVERNQKELSAASITKLFASNDIQGLQAACMQISRASTAARKECKKDDAGSGNDRVEIIQQLSELEIMMQKRILELLEEKEGPNRTANKQWMTYSASIYRRLARLYAQTGNVEVAEEALERALRFKEHDAYHHRTLRLVARSCVRRQQPDLKEAAILLEKAIVVLQERMSEAKEKGNPSNDMTINELVSAYLELSFVWEKLEDCGKAISTLQECIDMPQFTQGTTDLQASTVYGKLGILYQTVGLPEKAVSVLSMAGQHSKKHEEKKQAKPNPSTDVPSTQTRRLARFLSKSPKRSLETKKKLGASQKGDTRNSPTEPPEAEVDPEEALWETVSYDHVSAEGKYPFESILSEMELEPIQEDDEDVSSFQTETSHEDEEGQGIPSFQELPLPEETPLVRYSEWMTPFEVVRPPSSSTEGDSATTSVGSLEDHVEAWEDEKTVDSALPMHQPLSKQTQQSTEFSESANLFDVNSESNKNLLWIEHLAHQPVGHSLESKSVKVVLNVVLEELFGGSQSACKQWIQKHSRFALLVVLVCIGFTGIQVFQVFVSGPGASQSPELGKPSYHPGRDGRRHLTYHNQPKRSMSTVGWGLTPNPALTHPKRPIPEEIVAAQTPFMPQRSHTLDLLLRDCLDDVQSACAATRVLGDC